MLVFDSIYYLIFPRSISINDEFGGVRNDLTKDELDAENNVLETNQKPEIAVDTMIVVESASVLLDGNV